MPKLPDRKAGIIACSGEELAEGTVTRLAALKVLQELRPGHTVTICLPLFLAGGEGDRAFARFHPTITIDGCELRCAARGTEMYSGKPAASIVVNDLAAEHGLGKIEGRRQLNAAGKRAVEIAAGRLAELVDEVLGRRDHPARGGEITEPAPQQTKVATCSCGSGIPMGKVTIDGQIVEIVALPLIFERFHQLGRSPDAAADELLATVKIYNYVPPDADSNFRQAIVREYAAFCREEAAQ
jgi:uncharacterized metal-binding protein